VSLHAYLGLAANNALFLGLGYAVLYALGLKRAKDALRMAGLAYVCGWAVVGIGLSYALMVGLGVDIPTVVGLAVTVTVLCVAVGHFTRPIPVVTSPSPHRVLGTVALAIGAAVIAVTTLAAMIIALKASWTPDIDVVYTWLPKAEIIYYHPGGIYTGADGWAAAGHPEYPPLASTMYALTFRFVGAFHPSLVPVQQTLLAIAFLGAVLALLERCAPRWVTVPALALLVISPGFFRRFGELLPDQTLAYLVTLSALTCAIWLRERRAAWLTLAIALSAAATLTKLEGETYGLLLAIIAGGGAVILRKRRVALTSIALLLGPAAVVPWRIWLGDHGFPTTAEDYHFSSLLHPVLLADRAGRLPYAIEGIVTGEFRPSEWLPILPLTLVVIAAVLPRRPTIAVASATWLVLASLGLLVVYWIGFMPEPRYVNETAHRVTGTIVIVAAVMLPLVLGLGLGLGLETQPESAQPP
jgi:hypothetical protein